MDPNIIACPDWRDLLGQLADSKARVDINQGMDIRMMTDEKMDAINAVRLKAIHFAWDRDEDLEPIFRKWADRIKVHPSRRMVYCLINYNTTTEFDLHRIYTLRDLGYEPYVMVYDKENAPRDKKRMARWVNNKAVFRKCKLFDDYKR